MILYQKIKALLAGRSSRWPTVRAAHLKSHPTCAACGGKSKLEVHHILPVHVYPNRELDTENLITLCDKRGCHFAFGHLYDWKSWNAGVVGCVDGWLRLVRVRPKSP